MTEPIDIEEINRKVIKRDFQKVDFEHDQTREENTVDFKGHKIEHIDPKNSKARNLFKKNIQNGNVEER